MPNRKLFQADFELIGEAVRAWCRHNSVDPNDRAATYQTYANAIRFYSAGYCDLAELIALLIAEVCRSKPSLRSTAIH